MMNKVAKHHLPKRRVADRLRRMGLAVTTVSPTRGYDLLVNNHIRIALRVAFPRLRNHTVTSKNRRYTYRYRSWHFNFHRHGRIDRRYADVIICYGMEPHDDERDKVFVIPWEAVSGKTFSLHAARNEYEGQYAQYRDRWSVVSDALHPPTESTEESADSATMREVA
jgi:hypothetical protein